MDNFFKALRKNCSEILKVYQTLIEKNGENLVLYRGTKVSHDALYGKFDARKAKIVTQN